ncbi:MAG: hypothetical protein JW969_17310 [Spirochaetales bacterium]|nr:hypothetical protein [Spirochaetales bacterium]
MTDMDFLKQITEVPSVGTACLPIIRIIENRLFKTHSSRIVEDGFCLFIGKGSSLSRIKILIVCHLDEIGGYVTAHMGGDKFGTEYWGNTADVFLNTRLAGFDYLSGDVKSVFPVSSIIENNGTRETLLITGKECRPFRTVWTFDEKTGIDSEWVEGKAIDPRATVYAAIQAACLLKEKTVGLLFVMAEECSVIPARKAAVFCQKHMKNLSVVINADVPDIGKMRGIETELPCIRLMEKGSFIDPFFGLSIADALTAKNLKFGLTYSMSASQTIHFSPVAKTVSIALPGYSTHRPRGRIRKQSIESCIELCAGIAEICLKRTSKKY